MSPTIEIINPQVKDIISLSAESGNGDSGRFSDIFGLLPKV